MKNLSLFLGVLASMPSSVFGQNESAPESMCQKLNYLTISSLTRQVLIVQSKGGINAQLTACIRDQQWHATLFPHPIAAVLGKKGLASSGSKKEGDLKTPSGLYPIKWTFGTQPLALKMDFKFITAEDKFIDDPKHPQYNTWVTGPTSAKSYEVMVHPLYKMGAIVNYNMNPIRPGAGSAIFIHLWKSPQEGTEGCIAMDEQHLVQILHWFDKAQHPYIFITNE